MASQEDKLDEALKQTFPASDAFYLPPYDAAAAKAGEKKKESDEQSSGRQDGRR